MKLRNKKTGEIGHFTSTNWNEIALIITDDNGVQLAKYSSLAELNKDWEDAPEEPKEYWFINDLDGTSFKCELRNSSYRDFDEWIKKRKQIGNYFESEEEAEEAVEKLRAWKRLKDKGFKFVDFNRVNDCASLIRATFDEGWSEIYDDLNTCFGGEE